MATTPDGERLAEMRYATLVLRLALDRNGRLLHGELTDVERRAVRRFTNRDEALLEITAWIKANALELIDRDAR